MLIKAISCLVPLAVCIALAVGAYVFMWLLAWPCPH